MVGIGRLDESGAGAYYFDIEMPTRYRGDEREVRALNALITLLRAAEAVTAELQRELAPERLTISQLGVLESLLHLGPLCQGELARKLLRSCASTTSVVEGLEKRGYVIRQRTEEDKRFVRVALTTKGRRRIEEIFPGHAATITRLLGALEVDEQEQLRRLCRKLGTAVAGA